MPTAIPTRDDGSFLISQLAAKVCCTTAEQRFACAPICRARFIMIRFAKLREYGDSYCRVIAIYDIELPWQLLRQLSIVRCCWFISFFLAGDFTLQRWASRRFLGNRCCGYIYYERGAFTDIWRDISPCWCCSYYFATIAGRRAGQAELLCVISLIA